MSISIYDMIPKTQSFLPFKDSESIFQDNLSFCGSKNYFISNVLITLAPPESNLIDANPWTISAVTNDIKKVGVHQVKLTVTLANYTDVAAKSVTFNLTIID